MHRFTRLYELFFTASAQQRVRQGALRATAAVLLCLAGLTAFAGNPPGGDRQYGTEFVMHTPSVSSEMIVFDYLVPFAGLTKVRLFDENGTMLWRNQYLDEPGPRKIKLRASSLESGRTYTFVFDYKLTSVTKEIPIP